MKFDLLGLDDAVRRDVQAVAAWRRFDRGVVLFHEGEAGGSLHVLMRGRVAIRATTPDGDTVTLNVIGPGAAFGELSLLDSSTTRTALCFEARTRVLRRAPGFGRRLRRWSGAGDTGGDLHDGRNDTPDREPGYAGSRGGGHHRAREGTVHRDGLHRSGPRGPLSLRFCAAPLCAPRHTTGVAAPTDIPVPAREQEPRAGLAPGRSQHAQAPHRHHGPLGPAPAITFSGCPRL